MNVTGWTTAKATPKYVEWMTPVDDFIIDQKRVMMEVRICKEWDIVIFVHGRKVYSESIQTSYVEHTPRGVTEVGL